MAIEVDKDGRLVKVENGVQTYVTPSDPAQQKQWQAAVQAAIQRNGTTDPSHSRFMVVEQGDSIWSITHQVGSPFGEATDKNRFANDDLIYAGQVVEIPEPEPQDAAALGPEGRDAFAQSIASRASDAANADSSTATQQWDAVNGDIKSYLNSVPQDDFIPAAFDLIGNKGFTEDARYARQLTIKNVLDSLGNDKDAQQQMVNQLLKHDWPANGDDIKFDVSQEARLRGLSADGAQAPAAAPQTDPKLVAIQTAADSGDRGALQAAVLNYIGQVTGADNAAAFKTLSSHDWGKSAPLVREELYNAVVRNVNSPVPVFTNPGTPDPVPGNVQRYIRNYLSALPEVCSDLPEDQRQYFERSKAADKLSAQDWTNNDATKPLVKAARNELGIPEK